MQTILLVDDEKWVRTAIRKTIEKTSLPYRIVQECSSGYECLDWLKGHKADLIISDIKMPGMDGITLLQTIRLMDRNQGVIFVSGYDDFSLAQAALRHGAFDYLLKPVEKEDITECLEKWTEKSNVNTIKPETDSIDKVIDYINKTLPKDVTLSDAAKHVHLNTSYLSQLFKKKMKMNFSDYVQSQKIREAEKLVAFTTLPITEIAYRLGYSDISHFSNVFKRINGLTPSAYRKSYLK